MEPPVPDWRRRLMSRIGVKDTAPEMIVRRIAHSLGYRYRLSVRSLPGSPDLVFAGRRKVIFVHGCFWHRHDCPRGTMPKARREFWKAKLTRNKERDAENVEKLKRLGWLVLTIWECETKNPETLVRRLSSFLGELGTR